MPSIKVPEITLPSIDIPDAPYFIQHKLGGKIPGCNLYHRDLETTRNPSLLISDPNGTFVTCPEGQIPSFDPIRYDASEIIFTEDSPVNTAKENQEQTIQPPKRKEKKLTELPPCPGPKDQRIKDFRNSSRLERVSGHKRGEDGVECITIYENVPFVDSFLPSPSAAINVVTISLLAASSPLLLGVLKSVSKTVFKKVLTKSKKDKIE